MEISDACEGVRARLENARHTAVNAASASHNSPICPNRSPGNPHTQCTKIAIQNACAVTSSARNAAFAAT